MPGTNDKPAMTRRSMMRWLGGIALALGILLAGGGWLLDKSTVLQLGGLCMTLGVIWLFCSIFTSTEPVRVADRHYLREMLLATAGYTLLVILLFPLARRVEATWLQILLALAPVAPALLMARAMVRQMLAGDELERRMQLEATAIAAVVVGLLSLSTGFLEASGIISLQAGLLWVLPALVAVWGLALWWARRRYRAE